MSIVLIPGVSPSENESLWKACHATLDASTLTVRLPNGAGPMETSLPLFAGRLDGDGHASLYICRGETCSLPVHTAEAFHQLSSSLRAEKA